MLNKDYDEFGCSMADEFLSAYILPLFQQEASEKRWIDVFPECFYVLTTETGDWLCLDFVVPGLYRQRFKVGCDETNFMTYSKEYYSIMYEFVVLSSDNKIAEALKHENMQFKELLNTIYRLVFKSTYGLLFAEGTKESEYEFECIVPTKCLFNRFVYFLDVTLPLQKQCIIGMDVDENNPNKDVITEEIKKRIDSDGHFAIMDPFRANFKEELPF